MTRDDDERYATGPIDPTTARFLIFWLVVVILILAGFQWEFETLRDGMLGEKAVRQERAAAAECAQHTEECPDGRQ